MGDIQRPPAVNHEVLGNNFKPVHHRLARQYMLVMRCAPLDSDPVLRQPIKPIRWHALLRKQKRRGAGSSYQPPYSQNASRGSWLYPGFFSSAGILEPSVAQPPLPLQEFLPLQPLSLALQPPLPLQEFWPLQACFSFTFLSAFLSAFLSWLASLSCALREDFSEGSSVEALTATPVPATNPRNATPATQAFVVFG